MTFEQALADLLCAFDAMTVKSLGDFAALLRAHGATPEETARELAWHRGEREEERKRVAQQFAEETASWGEGWFDRGGALH